MSFQVVSNDNELLLKISGWTAALTMRKEIKIPYTMIEEIRVGSYKFPWKTAVKRTGITTSGHKAGIFMIEGKKYFLAYHSANEIVMLRLKEHEFDYVVFESGNNEQLVNDILKRCPSINIEKT
ncbi:hypothetical protein J6TS1_33400 [Siminovitchia terrae]|uniref:Bacterial Pleckstrin homology domain-containing protein n=1 Tax=Siminovitchia terrae TaxID=1914933 RepID=A0A429X822_SIMTE|nr:hypothetical protein [Siminovitchia terrae]RST59373.1 hypothetical protein D5F11_012315 [Siminovitchia terrae]GIN97470.1 hypothetical protein J6TS1_33400 [Siminovitchia terrae]